MSQPTQQRILKTALPGPQSLELHAKRTSVFSDSFGVTIPVYIEEAGGGILVDVDGNHIIDLAAGIAVTSVGASHPKVVAAIQEQAQKFTHTGFLVTQYDLALQVAERLNKLTPGDFEKRTGLFSTGAEAVENAVKISRTYTGRDAVVVLGHAYHGRTLLTMTMTSKNAPYKEGFGPFAPEVYRVPSPYPYRWTGRGEDIAQEAFDQLADQITTQIGAHNVAAIIVEPIQGEGGFIVPPAGYLAKISQFAKDNGIVFVADEIQAGLGRTGRVFAVDHEDVVPDLIITAKALAGGLPLSAVTGRAEIMNAVPAGGLGGTYSGNPIACAAAVAALDVIVDEDLPGKARRIEELARPRLEALLGSNSPVGDVRGRGAMLALEFVKPGSKTPDAEAAKKVAAYATERGVLTLTAGTYGNVIRLLPPLVISEDLLDDALTVLEAGVEALG
ncbi:MULTISPECIES: 4-aminobutyrate--2-oxoglutarate transaminase [Rhodococcus erythropolis group]|uniref:4-aminobutyrate--2-oxoglutarate transaminase n=1 Tax=Rhodococcus erythropolis group TaxID=2840174 RepID=UPI001BE8E7A6|nr:MULTISPECIES: 4-aminobutyrate--2-oxoglutarate transaminase [Rhodococcus erythropolis group]MBT2266111.1 4-aminobutyrate--2-oxoglutarate transaminase [Rhodococcus erythropolis]MBT2274288.1 4-aminobutyrate--2-oxoglutarate transaminase [Rhodococcus qingshengii]